MSEENPTYFLCGRRDIYGLMEKAKAEAAQILKEFSMFYRTVYTKRNIRTLFVNSSKDSASITVKTVFCPIVTYFSYSFSCYGLNIYVTRSSDFAHYKNKSRSYGRFASNSCVWIFF